MIKNYLERQSAEEVRAEFALEVSIEIKELDEKIKEFQQIKTKKIEELKQGLIEMFLEEHGELVEEQMIGYDDCFYTQRVWHPKHVESAILEAEQNFKALNIN